MRKEGEEEKKKVVKEEWGKRRGRTWTGENTHIKKFNVGVVTNR